MGKNPAFLFYPNDWMRDLEEHPLEIEGAWIRICCKLWWSETKGSLARTLEQWSKILRVSEMDAERILKYLGSWHIANVTFSLPVTEDNKKVTVEVTVESRRMTKDEKNRKMNMLRQRRFKEKRKSNAPASEMDAEKTLKYPRFWHMPNVTFPLPVTEDNKKVTVESRRMTKDEKNRKMNMLRQRRFKEKRESNAPVTEESQRFSVSVSKKRKILKRKTLAHFDLFWKAYPKKKSKGQAEKAWSKIKPDQTLLQTILKAIDQNKQSAQWQKDNGQYIPHPATWLNAKGWEDEIATQGDASSWQAP